MRFVDEQDDVLPFFTLLLDLVEDSLDSFFVLSLVLGAGHQTSQVKGE